MDSFRIDGSDSRVLFFVNVFVPKDNARGVHRGIHPICKPHFIENDKWQMTNDKFGSPPYADSPARAASAPSRLDICSWLFGLSSVICHLSFCRMRSYQQPYEDYERIIEIDFLRATEAAALNTLPWIGRGEKEKADAAACDAIRGMFDLMNICGEVVIGEGIKDNAPGIFKGEHLGTWSPGSHKFDLALDPIDGTTNVSKGLPGSICCIAAASPEHDIGLSMKDVPTFYMMKLAYGLRVVRYMQRTGIESLALLNPIEEI